MERSKHSYLAERVRVPNDKNRYEYGSQCCRIQVFTVYLVSVAELEPKCSVGVLAPNTEIHISPPVPKPVVQPVDNRQRASISSFLHELSKSLLKTNAEKPVREFSCSARLRVHPIENEGAFFKTCSGDGTVLQPYLAFLSKNVMASLNLKSTQKCVGRIRNEDRTTYFTVVFVDTDGDCRQLNPSAVYLSNSTILQLKLNIKQRVMVEFEGERIRNHVNGITFYTFVNVTSLFFDFSFD